MNNSSIKDYDKIILVNTFNNKSFKFNNRILTIIGENAIINNGQIIFSKNSRASISTLKIKNNENIQSSIILEGPYNTIKNINIIHNSTQDVNGIYSTNIGTKINNTNIIIISPKSNTIKEYYGNYSIWRRKYY